MPIRDFATWLVRVNRLVEDAIGVSIDSLPDWHYRDAFDAGVTPNQAARMVIKHATVWQDAD